MARVMLNHYLLNCTLIKGVIDMKTIIDTIIEARNGHYCHALEVSDVYELETVVESIIQEFPDRSEKEYLEFFNTIEVYSLDDANEKAIYDFSFTDYIKGTV